MHHYAMYYELTQGRPDEPRRSNRRQYGEGPSRRRTWRARRIR